VMRYVARGKCSRQRSSKSRWLEHYRLAVDNTRLSRSTVFLRHDLPGAT
jgi:hypothetical protein